jgi:hypothetical protein
MTFTPTVIIGLGEAGVQALDEIALGIIQGYGQSSLNTVSLLGFDFADRQPPAPVQHLTFQVSEFSIKETRKT